MRWIGIVRLRMRALFRRRAAESELNEELRAHLEETIEQNLARGMTPEEARRQALIAIGGLEQAKEECRDARPWRILADIWRDIGYGARMLRKSPGFAIAAILTLALGIGANVSMLGVVDALLFRVPAHIRAPEQLLVIGLVPKSEPNWPPTLSYPEYEGLSKNVRSLELAPEAFTWDVSLGRGVRARPINAGYVSSNYFRLLGTHMLLGRAFDAAEDQPTGSAPVVLLAYDLWQRAFGGDPKMLGRTVQIGGQERTVIGVAPKGFTGTGFLSVDAWLPLHAFQAFSMSGAEITVVGRPRKDASIPQVRAELASLIRPTDEVVGVIPLFAGRRETLSQNDRVSLWIAGVALIVLLIACVNVSSLLLARMAQRRHEMAVRQQLGATRERLMRQVLIEGLLLSAAGGAAALLVALAVEPLVRALLLPQGFYEGSFLNWRLLATAAALAIFAGCASGLAPAWRASGPRLAEILKSSERGHTREGSGLRWALVVTQIALALLLAVGAGLFIRSLRNADAFNLGFQPKGLLQATVDFPLMPDKEFSAAEISATYARLRLRAEQVPGVTRAALSSMLFISVNFTVVEKSDSGKITRQWVAQPRAVTPNYFSTMEIPILEGRPLLDSDAEGSTPVAVVNQSLASEVWRGQNPLGKCLRTSPKTACAQVVGVVADTWPERSIDGQNPGRKGIFYVPLSQSAGLGAMSSTPDGLLIRMNANSAAGTGQLFAALESALPAGRFVNIEPYTKMLDSQTRSWRMGASMFSLFGGLALVLAAIGIYGVLAFLVRQRTAEIGVRMALGATPRDVLRLLIGEGMKFAVLGVALGAGAAFALTRLMKNLLYGVTATDPLTFAASAAILACVALAACALAAWRATRVDPNVALRHE